MPAYGVPTATAQVGRAPAVVGELKLMLEHLPASPIGVRDRALLLLGFAGAFRRSELVSLDVEDLEIFSAGMVVTLRRSKTDQEARSGRIGIPYGSNESTCPVRSVQAWLTAARITSGPLFRAVDRFGRVQPGRLSDKAVALVVKRSVGRVDNLDPARYAGHSLRVGLATHQAITHILDTSLCLWSAATSGMVRYRRDSAAALAGL